MPSKCPKTHCFLMIHLDNVEIGNDKLYMLIIQLIGSQAESRNGKFSISRIMINTNGSLIWEFQDIQ